MTTTTRRSVLSMVAAAPAAAVPAVALPACIEPAPIFAAIERHRQLDAAWTAVAGGYPGEADEAGEDAWEAFEQLLATTPETVRGCAAMLRYLNGLNECYGCHLFDDSYLKDTAADLFIRLADRIEGAQSS